MRICAIALSCTFASSFLVTVPALPGLVTEGRDLEHARDMTKDAIRCHIEGLRKAKEPIPVEKETAQLKLSVVA
jgi:predicted RNase H-like HicB family nuclease